MDALNHTFSTPWKYGREVLGPSGAPGAYDEKAVDSPFVFRHGGRYHMMHVGFDGIGYQTSIAHSDDLLHWEKDAPLFRREELSGWDAGGIAGVWILRENSLQGPPALKQWDGKYWMVYHSYPDAGYEAGPACIGLAYTQDETLRNWTRLEQPVLRWQDGAGWERGGLYKGCLVEHEGRLYLFYNAKDGDRWLWREQIGLAVSDDMTHWTRLSDRPVVANGGGWDCAFCADPCVVQCGGEWLMFYYGYDGRHAQEGLARSADLRRWEKLPAPILRSGGPGSIDELHAHKPSVLEEGGRLYHFYCAVRPSAPGDRARNQDPTQSDPGVGEYRCITVASSAPFSPGRQTE